MVEVPPPWIAAVLAFVAAALVTVSIASLWAAWRDRSQRRSVLRNLHRLIDDPDDAVSERGALLRDLDGGGAGRITSVLARLPRLDRVERWLRQADVAWDAPAFLLVTAGSAVGLGAAALIVRAPAALALCLAAVGAALPYLYAGRRRARRLRRFEERLPEAIDLLSRAIRAGHPFSAGLRMVAREASEPVAGEFRQVFEEQRYGLPFEDSLLALVDRIPLTDTRIMTTAILVQREVGGNLAEILDKLAMVIRARFRFRRQLRVYTAQGRISGYVLAVLPIAVGTIFFLLNPEYMMTLFGHPVGKLLVAAAALLQLLGYLWIRRIVRIEP